MADYKVLARAYRPTTFARVVGQEHITATLQRAILKKRLAHAYLFSGDRGTGKTSTARIFSAAINCRDLKDGEPCGVCDSCVGIATGGSLDVIEIDGASNNGVENIRELCDNTAYASMTGGTRIYIIDEVHMLSKAAFNAFLKTLEEPKKGILFILCTTEPSKLPATIVSRCQPYVFKSVSEIALTENLEFICQSEGVAYEEPALKLLAEASCGSVRDSVTVLDRCIAACQERITLDTVAKLVGEPVETYYKDLMTFIAKKDVKAVLSYLSRSLDAGFELSGFVYGFEKFVRGRVIYRASTDLTSSQAAIDNLLKIYEILLDTEKGMSGITQPRYLVEIALIKMCRI